MKGKIGEKTVFDSRLMNDLHSNSQCYSVCNENCLLIKLSFYSFLLKMTNTLSNQNCPWSNGFTLRGNFYHLINFYVKSIRGFLLLNLWNTTSGLSTSYMRLGR